MRDVTPERRRDQLHFVSPGCPCTARCTATLHHGHEERREELSTPLCTVKIRSGGKTSPTQQKQKRPLKVSLGCPCTASDVLVAPPLCTMDMRKGGKKCLHHFARWIITLPCTASDVLVAPPLFSNPRRLHAYLGAGHLSEVPEEAGTWVVAYCFRCARWIITLPPKTHLKRMLLLLGKKMRPTTLHREDKECSEDKERREVLSTPLCTVKIRSGGKTRPTQQKQKRPLKVSLGCPCTASDVLVAPPLCTMDMRKGGKKCLHHFARWIITLPCTASDVLVAPPLFSNPRRLHAYLGAGHLSEVPEEAGT
ncbi:hypothetical protein PAMP_016540 [Pampus punctatissimus]